MAEIGALTADEASDVFTAAQGYIDAKDGLLAHYRTGTRPSEAFWRRYDTAKARWSDVLDRGGRHG